MFSQKLLVEATVTGPRCRSCFPGSSFAATASLPTKPSHIDVKVPWNDEDEGPDNDGQNTPTLIVFMKTMIGERERESEKVHHGAKTEIGLMAKI